MDNNAIFSHFLVAHFNISICRLPLRPLSATQQPTYRCYWLPKYINGWKRLRRKSWRQKQSTLYKMLHHNGTANDILISNNPEQNQNLYLLRNNPREQTYILLQPASKGGWIQNRNFNTHQASRKMLWKVLSTKLLKYLINLPQPSRSHIWNLKWGVPILPKLILKVNHNKKYQWNIRLAILTSLRSRSIHEQYVSQ